MIISAIKNYIRHVRFVFLIMGVVYFSVFVAMYGMYVYIQQLIVTESDTIVGELETIVKDILATTSIQDILENGFGIIVQQFLDLLRSKFDANIGQVVAVATLYSTMIVFACQVGVYLCRYSIRRDIREHKTANFVVAFLLRLLLNMIFAGLFAYLIYEFWVSTIFLIIIFFVLRATFDMIEAKALYLHDYKLLEVLTIKNIIECVIAYFMFFVITAAIIVLLWLNTNIVFALLVGIPFLLYLFEVVRYTSVEHLVTS